jgi:hypothetical protein
MPTSRASRKYTVFEAANESLKELFVTATTKPVFEAALKVHGAHGEPIAHWKPRAHRITVRSVEFELTAEEAFAYIQAHLAARPRSGWSFLPTDFKPRR